MKLLRTSLCVAVCTAVMQFTILSAKPASAQVYYYGYYGQPVVTAPVYVTTDPNYVVYSSTYLAWRSAGYYGGNWGPYYYNPPALAPYVSPAVIWPNVIPITPPMTGPYPW